MCPSVISNKAYKCNHLWTTGGGSRDTGRLNHPSKHRALQTLPSLYLVCSTVLRDSAGKRYCHSALVFSPILLRGWSESITSSWYMWTCLERWNRPRRVGKVAGQTSCEVSFAVDDGNRSTGSGTFALSPVTCTDYQKGRPSQVT